VQRKTHATAVVLIPPAERCEPIQAIRRVHDRQVRRWMPHITLLYPFVPREQFDEAAAKVTAVGAGIEPFEVRLADFRSFHHGGKSHTMWLAPEPPAPLVRLQAALRAAFPHCDDVSRYPQGFTPHLSVGQARGRDRLQSVLAELQRAWTPLTFRTCGVSLIWRGEPPDDAFRVDRECPFSTLR
jgi:2'-5' RNA ligase